MTRTIMKSLTLCSLVAIFAAGQAVAHTGVRDEVDEGKKSYNAFTITHGCGGDQGSQAYPVLGQSALFPFGPTAVWKNAAGTVIQTGGNGNGTISSATLALGVTGYAGLASPFATSQEIVDKKGNVQALFWKDGAMEPKLNAITPFKISAPTIANNCVKTLGIRVAVINYCDVAKNATNDNKGPYNQPKDAFGRKIPKLTIGAGIQTKVAGAPFFVTMPAGNGDNNRADWWFSAPVGGSFLYKDQQLLNEWSATLIVNNSAADLAKCKGTKVDVTVEPHGAAFDDYLTGPNTSPFALGNSNL